MFHASLTRRSFLRGAAIAGGASALTLAGCGAGAGGNTSNGDGGKKVLKFGIGTLNTLDMQLNGMTVAGSVCDAIFEPLLRWTDDLQLVPCLLTEIPTFEDDGVTLGCTLKDGVTFHDGSKLTSQDVKYTFERMFNPATHATNYAGYLGIVGAQDMLDGKATELSGITIQDDTHFTFTLTEPSGVFVSNLGVNYADIYPHEACAAAGDQWGTGTNLVGTGKYKIVSNDDSTQLVMQKNEDYHEADDTPALDEIDVLFYSDSNTRMLGFKNGDIDFTDVPQASFDQYKNDSDVAPLMHEYLPLGLQFVNINLKQGMGFEDERVRQALSLAINRQEIIDTILAGYGQAASGWLTPQIPGFDSSAEAFAYDPDRAKALLAEAGATGMKLDLRVRSLFEAQANVLQAEWNAVGFDCSIQVMENAGFFSDWAAGNIQVLYQGWFADYPDGDGMLYNYFKSDVAATKSSFYDSSEFDDLVTRAHGNLPADQRADLYKQADQLLCRQDYATVPVLYPHYNYVARDYVKNVKVGNLALHLQDLDVQR